MDDKTKTMFLLNPERSFNEYKNKKFINEIDSLSETEKSVLKLIKNKNEVVSYEIEEKSIFLQFFDGVEDMRIQFYINEQGNIQARIVI